MPEAAGARLPGRKAALHSPEVVDYAQVKNVTEGNFSSSQVWAETGRDLASVGREEPQSLHSSPGGKQGAAPTALHSGPVEVSWWATLLHPHAPPPPPQLRAAGPSLNPGFSHHGGIQQVSKSSQGSELLVQRPRSMRRVHSLFTGFQQTREEKELFQKKHIFIKNCQRPFK